MQDENNEYVEKNESQKNTLAGFPQAGSHLVKSKYYYMYC